MWRTQPGAALEAGTEALAEAFAHVAVNLYTNYFNHYAGTELDVPAAPALDDPVERAR